MKQVNRYYDNFKTKWCILKTIGFSSILLAAVKYISQPTAKSAATSKKRNILQSKRKKYLILAVFCGNEVYFSIRFPFGWKLWYNMAAEKIRH